MEQRIENMSFATIAKLGEAERHRMFREAATRAIRSSIEHGDATLANKCLGMLRLLSPKKELSDGLRAYFETWGNLSYSKKDNRFNYRKLQPPSAWNSEYSRKVAQARWWETGSTKTVDTVVDADKEIRRVVERLKRAQKDPERVLLHETLLKKVEEAVYSYGFTDEAEREAKRARTLFDESTKRQLMRGNKLCKELAK